MKLWKLWVWKIKGRRMGARIVQFYLCGQGISRCAKIEGRRMGARNVQCSLCGQVISSCAKIQVTGGESCEK